MRALAIRAAFKQADCSLTARQRACNVALVLTVGIAAPSYQALNKFTFGDTGHLPTVDSAVYQPMKRRDDNAQCIFTQRQRIAASVTQ